MWYVENNLRDYVCKKGGGRGAKGAFTPHHPPSPEFGDAEKRTDSETDNLHITDSPLPRNQNPNVDSELTKYLKFVCLDKSDGNISCTRHVASSLSSISKEPCRSKQ